MTSRESGSGDDLATWGGPLERPARMLSAERILAVTALVLLPLALIYLFWIGKNAFFLLFAGILLAAILDAGARGITNHTSLARKWAIGIVIGAVVIVLAALAWFAGHYLVTQAGDLYDALQAQARRIGAMIDRFRPGGGDPEAETPAELLNDATQMMAGGDGGAGSFVKAVLGALANAFIVFFIGVFLALDPHLYKRGLTRLFPVKHRETVDDALHRAGGTLRQWLIGKLLSMAMIFVFTLAGLWLIGYPLAIPLALLAGLLAFVPNLGPILTYIPIAMAGFSDGVSTVLMGVAVYAVAQTIESYIFTPLIQKRMVSLPPALILFTQVLGGLLFGLWGVALATPIAAVLRLWIDRYYVRAELEGKAAT